MKKLSIVSVYDKNNLGFFAKGLLDAGVEILSTGGTARFLKENGIGVRSISEYTGSPEILDGRVKSLHPKIHGGILARRDRADDMSALTEHGISPIDFVVVNLYPFTKKVRELEQQAEVSHGSLVEDIDIGGPTMIRAAAKNARFVVPVCDPNDYSLILEQLSSHGDVSQELRQYLAAKVFRTMAVYDGAIARYFSLQEKLFDAQSRPAVLAPIESFTLERTTELACGPDSTCRAALYRKSEVEALSESTAVAEDLSETAAAELQGAFDAILGCSQVLKDDTAAAVVKRSDSKGNESQIFFVSTTRQGR